MIAAKVSHYKKLAVGLRLAFCRRVVVGITVVY
jgi:hypothetical protein